MNSFILKCEDAWHELYRAMDAMHVSPRDTAIGATHQVRREHTKLLWWKL